MTILLLIFGIGAVAPKMIQTALIAQGDSRLEETRMIEAGAKDDKGTPDTTLENQKAVASENMNEFEKNNENIKEIEENFPIKSAETETDVQNKNATPVKETTQSVDTTSASIDNTAANKSALASKDVASTNPTVKAAETAKPVVETPVTAAPGKTEITLRTYPIQDG